MKILHIFVLLSLLNMNAFAAAHSAAHIPGDFSAGARAAVTKVLAAQSDSQTISPSLTAATGSSGVEPMSLGGARAASVSSNKSRPSGERTTLLGSITGMFSGTRSPASATPARGAASPATVVARAASSTPLSDTSTHMAKFF